MFDVIIGNPPYQEKKPEFRKSQRIWPFFTERSLDILSQDGYLSFIHPSGWRNIDGAFKKIQKKMLSKQFVYLEIHDVKDGEKTFGACTRYDWYIIRNSEPSDVTEIKSQDGLIYFYDISKWEFIPNGMLDEIFSLLAKDGEEKIVTKYTCKYSSSNTKIISPRKTDEFQYPCVTHVSCKNDLPSKVYYSSVSDPEFNIPKLIVGRLTSGVMEDFHSGIGTTQHTFCITTGDTYFISASIEELLKIKKVMKSKEFLDLMKFCDVGGIKDWYPRSVVRSLRKDFWKEFINDEI